MLKIFVMMKRTFDTEEKIAVTNGKVGTDGAEYIINPYDEYAIEEAIQLREKHGGEVTVVTIGDAKAEKELRTALAMGCDQAVLIHSGDDAGDFDQFTTANIMAAYLRGKEFDLVLGGNVAIDGGSGQVGPRVAELLDIPVVTTITKIDIEGTRAIIERDVEGDKEIVETTLPLLATAQQGLNEPRYPSLPGIMKAKKKPLEEIALAELAADQETMMPKTKRLEVYLPPKKAAGKILQGELEQQVKELISLLHTEAKVI